MRNILDKCVCGGVLIPKSPLPAVPMSRARQWALDMHVPLDAAARRGRGDHRPESTRTLIAFLACQTCGLMYTALRVGQTIESLREAAYKAGVEVIDTAPEACPHCQAKTLSTERAQGPYGIRHDIITSEFLEDPRRQLIGLYCKTCNTILGTLSPDPVAVAAYEEERAAFNKSIAEQRKKRDSRKP